MKRFRSYYVPLLFLILSVIGMSAANVSNGFILGELYSRFVRNGMFLLALLLPIMVGMGINFSITIGALSAQMAMIIVIDFNMLNKTGALLMVVLALAISFFLGNIIGILLNKAKGKEMIASIVIGLLGTNIYQLIFMVGYGTVIKPFSQDILLARGIGIKSMLDAMPLAKSFNSVLPIKIGNVDGSLLPIIIIIFMTIVVYLISNSRHGYHARAVGDNMALAEKHGIDVNKTRKTAIIISTMLAALGQLMHVQNLGIVNVYTGHLNLDVFSAAALLAGGATFKKASIKNVYLGLFLFHTMFIVSPIAGQNMFQNQAIGEYFRTFVAYGTIVFALMVNLKNERMSRELR